MPNFFVDSKNITDTEARICGDDARHIARSLRMAEGDAITVCDGEGTQYGAILTRIRDDECIAEIKDSRRGFGESPVRVTLFMAYPKSDKLELIVQKTTELGVFEIVPFESSRCIKRPKIDKLDKTTARLERIAEEAAKQCGRSRIPKISQPISLGEVVGRLGEFDLSLFCYERASKSDTVKSALSAIGKSVEKIAVIVGCEGGFSTDEAEKIILGGAASVSLGERILRCETAPDFILSVLSYHFEIQ